VDNSFTQSSKTITRLEKPLTKGLLGAYMNALI